MPVIQSVARFGNAHRCGHVVQTLVGEMGEEVLK
jgi:hypothetical protein